jgi:sugar/nucleoside kinase (ribokinase family)
MKHPDIVGLGAINVDFIASASSPGLQKLQSMEYGGIADFGTETVVEPEILDRDLQRIGQVNLHADPGGSALNVLHALAHLDLGISLGMVGVAGRSPAREVDFGVFFEKHRIDTLFVSQEDDLAGRCLSFVHNGERTMFTTPGANQRALDYISDNEDDLVNYLSSSRITHLTSFLDDEAPALLRRLMKRVRERNRLSLLSFDPGFTWASLTTDPIVGPEIHGLLELCSLLFLNHNEFHLLGEYQPGETDDQVAERLFSLCSSSCELRGCPEFG